MIFDTKEIVIGGTEWKTAPFRFSKMLTLGDSGSAPITNDFITQSGDTIVTSDNTPLALDGISSLTAAPSITDTQLTFADDGNSTVSFSMQQLKDYVSPAPVGQGRFVAVAWGPTNQYVYSDDGETWTAGTMPSSKEWSGVAFGNGKFVTNPYNNNAIAYSDDGINWTETTSISDTNRWGEVQYCGDKFIILGSSNSSGAGGTTVFTYSSDGINWQSGTMPSKSFWNKTAYGNGVYVAIGATVFGNASAYSSDGITWTSFTKSRYDDITFGNGLFINVGRNDGSSTDKYLYSSNGTTWTQGDLPTSSYWVACAYGGEKFVIISGGQNNAKDALYSSDGINWNSSILPVEARWQSITYGNGKFVAITNSNIIAYSSDGITWTQETLPTNVSWRDITYGEI